MAKLERMRAHQDLIDFGSVKRALLGVSMSQIDDKRAKDLKLFSPKGVYIEEVVKGGAADKAGIQKGDVIVAVDSTEITTPSSVQEKVSSYHPGDKAEITIVRDGKEKTVEVTFQGTSMETGSKDVDGSVAFYGAKLKKLSDETRSQLGLKRGVERRRRGLSMSKVLPETARRPTLRSAKSKKRI